jgi:ABC-type Na+ transport system ATPase subunit NatA
MTPTGLDIVQGKIFCSYLAHYHGERHSLIYVTHHVEEITPLFKKIFISMMVRNFFKERLTSALSMNVFSYLLEGKEDSKKAIGSMLS